MEDAPYLSLGVNEGRPCEALAEQGQLGRGEREGCELAPVERSRPPKGGATARVELRASWARGTKAPPPRQ